MIANNFDQYAPIGKSLIVHYIQRTRVLYIVSYHRQSQRQRKGQAQGH